MKSQFEESLNHTVRTLSERIFPKDNKYCYLVLASHIIHFLVGVVLFLFLFFPPSLQPLVTVMYLCIMFSWRLFDGCIITIISNYFSDFDGAVIDEFNWDYLYVVMVAVSMTFYFYPKISFYHFVVKLSDRLLQYVRSYLV